MSRRSLRAVVVALGALATPEEPRLPVLRYGGLEIDLVRRLVVLDDEPVHLTPTE